MGSTVAITGVGGLVGRRLVERLAEDPEVDRIVGLDITPPDGMPTAGGLELRVADVRDADLARSLQDCDTLIHLAFLMDEPDDRTFMRAVNIDGTINVFRSAVDAGVSNVIYVSSAVAYGAHPDNDFPLTEASPLRANPDFAYAEHKREVEQWLWPWLEGHPDLEVAVLRPWVVAGPGVDNWFVRQLVEGTMLGSARAVRVKGYRPPWQFTHLEDLVEAIEHVRREGLEGPFNVASEGWLSADEVQHITGMRTVEIPEGAAFDLAERLWSLDLAAGPPGAVHYTMHPIVLSVDRLMATGWRPKHSNRDALRELREEHEAYVPLKHNVRVRKRDLRLAVAGVVGLLAIGVVRAIAGRGDD